MAIYIVPSAEGYVIKLASNVATNTKALAVLVSIGMMTSIATIVHGLITSGRISMYILENFNVASFALGLLVGVGIEFIIWLFLLFIGGIKNER